MLRDRSGRLPKSWDPGTCFFVNLLWVSQPTSALPSPKHIQAPYLCLWSHLSDRRQVWETKECLTSWEWWWGRLVWDNHQSYSTRVLARILKPRVISNLLSDLQSSMSHSCSWVRGRRREPVFSAYKPFLFPPPSLPSYSRKGLCLLLLSQPMSWWLWSHRGLSFTACRWLPLPGATFHDQQCGEKIVPCSVSQDDCEV